MGVAVRFPLNPQPLTLSQCKDDLADIFMQLDVDGTGGLAQPQVVGI